MTFYPTLVYHHGLYGSHTSSSHPSSRIPTTFLKSEEGPLHGVMDPTSLLREFRSRLTAPSTVGYCQPSHPFKLEKSPLSPPPRSVMDPSSSSL
ncbi:hypothetical protein NLI96_g9179 [Meripilus lineatus]|uniref:Uncharacterized protein n=1 Tax=Meripilus lineatus TaxID=2056292 RepID=A0AAD5UW38_9APHY|nr:hypothetical protein NLI96_g9179 [Physisporinus lineatus]